MQTHDITEDLMDMVETMERIYLKNCTWLETYDKPLYKKIIKNRDKILKNKDKEKFCVELTQEGALDILDKKSGEFIYHTDPFVFGDNKAIDVEEKLKSIVFDGVLLGTHITSTIKLKKPKKVTIVEKNLQIFNCSLYITDYQSLSEISKIKFEIDNEFEPKKKDIVIKPL